MFSTLNTVQYYQIEFCWIEMLLYLKTLSMVYTRYLFRLTALSILQFLL